MVVRECRKRGVEALTLYSFSTENWKRPPEEVSALMTLLKRYVLQERQELMEQGIRVRCHRADVPASALRSQATRQAGQ